MIEPRSFAEVGLPAGQQVLRLDYHELTRTIIAHIGPLTTPPPCGRLYFRRDTDAGYQPIGSLAPRASVEGVALDPRRPVLYFLTDVYRAHDGGGWGGDWDALYRFDLGAHRCERVLGPNDLPAPEGYTRAWLCAALSVSADGRSLFCTAGLEAPAMFETKNGAVTGSRVSYWVARLDLGTRTLTAISELEAIWA